jgi:sugar lactone lactonase YvrE
MTAIAGGSGLPIPSSGNMACAGATDKYGDGCQGTAISFTSGDDMRAVVADPFGSVYLSDISATLVRRISPNGVISNFAGLVSGTACVPTASSGCKPTLVSIGKARGVGSDAGGDIFIANYTGNEVFEVKRSTGLLYLIAGTGTGGATGDGNAATSAEINQPRGAWGDTIGNVYIADTANNKIRVVDTTGNIHTFAGNGTAGSNGDGAPATSAEINNPQGVIADTNLNVYIADSSGGRIRVVCVTCGTNSPLDALLAKLGIASPVNGYIYTVAGSGSTSTDSYTGPVLSTGVSMAPQKLAFDPSGNLYISDSNGFIWFLDFHTGYLRAVARNAAICANHTDNYGDGCPATQASFGSNGGNGMGVGADALGNIYISDGTNVLIRKVITGLQSPSTATGTTATLPVEIHFTAGDGPAASNAFAYTSTEWSLGTPTCTSNADTTNDCLLSSGFTPAVPGTRSTPLTVNSALGNTANLGLIGIGLGAGSTLDPATKLIFGANLQVAGLATDTAGNLYVSDSVSKKLFRFAPSAFTQGASAPSTTLATLTAPGPVAVDPRGFVYVGDTFTGLITQISPSGTTSTLSLSLTTPAGLAVDALNNLYVSDSATQSVYQIDPITGATNKLITGTLVAPAGLAIDPSGNLLITDPGAGAIYRFNQQTSVTSTVSSTAVKPSAIATDAAGNLLIADTADILAVPASNNSPSFTVASLAPSALAIDSAGNLYTGSGSSILELTRTQGYVQFAAASVSPTTVDLLNSGNLALQLSSIGQTDTADYSLAGTASTDCTLSGTLPSTLAVGGVCALTATYTPTTFATTTDTATFNGNYANAALSLPSSVQLTLTGPETPPTASIAITFSPASPAYGQTVIATATVTGLSLTPAGTVQFTVDGSNTVVTLSGSVATLSLPSLSTGAHTVSAVYTSTDGYPPATETVTLTVGKATPTVTLTSNVNPVLAQSAITFTAKVTSTAGTPTQTVTFLDGTTPIGTGTLSGGVATLTTTTLAAGTHSITAAYGGDTSFAAASSSPLAELVEDFGFTISAPSITVLPGGTAVFTFTVAPVDASTFFAAINLTVSGLPPGATYTISPANLAAGAGSSTVTLTINVPQTQASATPYTMHSGQELAANQRGSGAGHLARRLTPFALALLLLPFAGRLRRDAKKLGRMMLMLLLLTSGAAIMTWIGGCGGTSGYFTQQQQTYTVTVTGAEGTLSHSATVSLTVQ